MKNSIISETDELLDELCNQWVENYKKSALTLVILRCLSHQPLWAKPLGSEIARITGWNMTERGLYRTLQRMTELEVIEYDKQDAPKSGAHRKMYAITELGTLYLKRIELAKKV